MKTLLEKAKEVKLRYRTRTDYSKEEIELAIAWMKDEIRVGQVGKVLGKGSTAIGYRLAMLIRAAYRQGKIKA